MKKLTQLLKESQHLDYRRMNVGEEDGQGMTKEEKRAFVEAVAAYRQLGEMISHKGNISEIHDSIKGIVENANNLTLKETGDWFDRVTVQRHMKSMNESFKVFSNTIKEVSTLQQRLESSYDEIGEVLGKYYEIKEGNEFGAERAKAIAAGNDSFEVDGKSYKVSGVDAEDKKNAEEFANESMKLTSLIKRNEELTGKQKELDVDSDGDIEADDLADLRAGKKADESVNEQTLKQGTKLRYDKNNFVIDYVVDKEYKGSDGFPKYTLKVVKSNYPKKIKIGSTEEYESSKLGGLMRNGVIKFIKNESVNEGVSPADMDKIKGAVESASSFMSVGSELKKLGMKYTFATEPLPIYIIQPTPNNKVAVVNKKYATKPDFVVGDIAVGIMEGKLNEEEIKWNAVENAIINFLKMNTKILDKRVQAKDTEGVKGGLKSIISGLVNAQRNLKLESVNEAGYTVKAKNPYQFVTGAYAVLSAYLRDEELGPKGKRELQDIIKSLDYMRMYFYANMSESVNESQFKVGDNVIVTRKDGKEYTGKVEKLNPLKLRTSPSDTMVIPNAYIKDIVVKESVNEASTNWETHFKGFNEKELKVIEKFILMNPKGIDGVIEMSKKKDFKPFIQKAAKRGLGESKVNEEKYTVIDPMGNQKGVGPKIQAISMAKRLGGEKTGHFVVANTNALKARRALEKFKGDFKNPKLKDMMMNLYYESVNERIVKEKVK